MLVDLEEFSMFEILGIAEKSRGDLVTLYMENPHLFMVYSDGHVIFASYRKLLGEEAFLSALLLKKGQLEIRHLPLDIRIRPNITYTYEELLQEGTRRAQDFESVISRVGNLNVVPKVCRQLKVEQLCVNWLHWGIIVGAFKGLTVYDLADVLRVSEYDLAKALLDLVESGAISTTADIPNAEPVIGHTPVEGKVPNAEPVIGHSPVEGKVPNAEPVIGHTPVEGKVPNAEPVIGHTPVEGKVPNAEPVIGHTPVEGKVPNAEPVIGHSPVEGKVPNAEPVIGHTPVEGKVPNAEPVIGHSPVEGKVPNAEPVIGHSPVEGKVPSAEPVIGHSPVEGKVPSAEPVIGHTGQARATIVSNRSVEQHSGQTVRNPFARQDSESQPVGTPSKKPNGTSSSKASPEAAAFSANAINATVSVLPFGASLGSGDAINDTCLAISTDLFQQIMDRFGEHVTEAYVLNPEKPDLRPLLVKLVPTRQVASAALTVGAFLKLGAKNGQTLTVLPVLREPSQDGEG